MSRGLANSGWLIAALIGCVGAFAPICAAEPPATSTRIGNFYYQAPNGIAFIKDDAAAFVINPGGIFTPGEAAPDDSYHRILFTPAEAKRDVRVEFQWSREGEAIIGRIISSKPSEMSFRLGENWPGFQTTYNAAPDGVSAAAKLADGSAIAWSMRTQPPPLSADAHEVRIPLSGPTKPIFIVAGFGTLPPFADIDTRLAIARLHYENNRPAAQGPSGDILAAIADNLNNSRIYSTDNKTIAISVARDFNVQGPNYCPYFCWDSFFSALLVSLEDPGMGHQTVRAILAYQTPEGLVPNYAHWNPDHNGSSPDRSQPPVGAMCVWKMNQRWPDAVFLAEVFPKLAKWHAWWMQARNARHDGLLEWGSSTGKLQLAQYETGWDDTPHFEGVAGVKMVGSTMNVYAVDLCSLWAIDAHYLSLIADAVGKSDDAKRYRQEERDMIGRINARLWNEKLGIYCSRFWDDPNGAPGKFLTRLTPANFYPLICGAASEAQAKRVLAIMFDPQRFNGQWMLPTVSQQDPLYFQQTYWHGTVWGPVNYLVFQGVKRYASAQQEAEFAQKSVHLFMNNWLANGQCGENFLSLTGAVGGNQHYTWGALMCLVGLESIADIADDGTIKTGPGYNENVQLSRVPIGGKPFDITAACGQSHVTVNPSPKASS